MIKNLNEMFLLIGNDRTADRQEDLFALAEEPPAAARQYGRGDIDFILNYFTRGFDTGKMTGAALTIFELSCDAFDTVLHAWMSEEPVETEIIRFGRRVISSAGKAVFDRGDSDTLAVHASAGRVFHEVHRMMGLMRFTPDSNGRYTAKCAPDHFILPVLGEYFTSRFGETSWVVHDEKRNLFLGRKPGEKAQIFFQNEMETVSSAGNGVYGDASVPDKWETLWKHYHKTINNESRNNTGLQRQLMPKRYWKYLSEMENI